MTDNRPALRIGHDERNAAIRALDEHLSAGRLDPDEYGERMAAASVARTREELDKLFADLPEPHPFPRRPGYTPPDWQAPVTSQYPVPARRKVPLAAVAAAIVAFLPLIAVLLWILTDVGFVVLPLFVVGALLSRRGGRGCYRAGPRRW